MLETTLLLSNHVLRQEDSIDTLLRIQFLTDYVFLNPTAYTKVQKKYISYAEPLGSIASHVAYPQKQSRFFFSASFQFSLFPPTFLAFFPVNPWYH